MVKFTTVIIDKVGLHARPASIIAKEASKYESEIKIIFADKSANLKSIMNIMAMAIKNNSEVTVEADGTDEEAAIAGIKQIMIDCALIQG